MLFYLFIIHFMTAASAQQNPIISFISKEQVASIGDTVELKCEVQYADHYSVQWTKPDSDLYISHGSTTVINNDRFDVRQENNLYVLRISKLQEIDVGRYQCQIVLGTTSKIAADVWLYIRIPPVISDNSTRSVITGVGNAINLHCYAGGFPKPRISWRRENNELLPNGAAMYIGNVLHIPKIRKSDRGTYYCVADNGVGRGARRNIGVEVEFAPVVKADRTLYGQALQYNMDLQCRVEAFPSPSIVWKFDGQVLQNNQHQQISIFPTADEFTETNLHLITIEKRQYGNYTCAAFNKLGSDEKTIVLFETVNVICPPACDVEYIDKATSSFVSQATLLSAILLSLVSPYFFDGIFNS